MAATFKLLSTTSWTSNSSTVTLSSIPQTYDDLWVHIIAKNNAPFGPSNVDMRWNGLSTTIYGYRNMYLIQTTAGSNRSNSGANSIQTTRCFGSNANSPAHTIFYIPGYSGTTWRKICMYWTNNLNVAGNSEQSLTEGMGKADLTSAITSITLINNDGNVTSADSFVKLYGISRTV